MVASRTVAKDIMLALVKTVVDSEGLHAVYDDTDNEYVDQKPSSLTPWVRVLVRHRTGSATSLSNPSGIKRHEILGFVIVEIMTPVGDGNVIADDLAQKFENVFRVRSSLNQDVWYTDVRSMEVGQDDGWYKTNCIAEFHYDIFS